MQFPQNRRSGSVITYSHAVARCRSFAGTRAGFREGMISRRNVGAPALAGAGSLFLRFAFTHFQPFMGKSIAYVKAAASYPEQQINGFAIPLPKNQCEGWDLNPRTPSRLDPKSSAFDQARQPSRVRYICPGALRAYREHISARKNVRDFPVTRAYSSKTARAVFMLKIRFTSQPASQHHESYRKATGRTAPLMASGV